MTTPVRVAIAGFGSSAQGFHVPLVTAAGLQVVAVSTSDPGRGDLARQSVPGVHVARDVEELLAVPDLDLIVVATPSQLHADHAMAALEAGIRVVSDKPLAVTATQALEVVDTATRTGSALTVFQNRRYDPEFATLRRVLGEDLVGIPWRLELRWERWRPVPKDRWRERNDAEHGGGILLDLFTHLLDQAVVLFGPIERVYAELDSRTTVAEDDAFLTCRHTSGMISHVTACSIEGAPGPRVRLHGSAGTYLLAGAGDEPSAFAEFDNRAAGGHGWLVAGERRSAVPAASGPDTDPATFYRQVAAALSADDVQAAMPVDPRDAVHVLAVIDAARAGAQDHAVVEVRTPGASRG